MAPRSQSSLADALVTYWQDSAGHDDDSRHIRRKSQLLLVRRASSVRPRLGLSAVVTVVLLVLVALQLFTSFHLTEVLSLPSAFLSSKPTAWSISGSETLPPDILCPSCYNASVEETGSYATSPDFSSAQLLSRDQVRSTHTSLPTIKRYLLHHIVLQHLFDKSWMGMESTNEILLNYFTQPDHLLAYSFGDLHLDVPTTYMYTRTGPGGKLANVDRRIHSLSRHVDTLDGFQELVREKGYIDGTDASARQILWIVIEDAARIDMKVAEFLKESGHPYLYFAHGPTRWLGVAQWNAAERAVEVLRDTFFGDGPVLNADDDAKFHPELLSRVWKVKRAISWPVGNLAAPGGWEGAIFKNGSQYEWRLGGLAERIFPIDMNGFAINSTMIGPTRPIHGPWYVSVGDTGAETYFLEKIYSKRSELEGICDNTVEEGCWFAWWNWREVEEQNAAPLPRP